jgi:uncharacterized protein YcaQ
VSRTTTTTRTTTNRTTTTSRTLSADAARRIAVAAQGLNRPRPTGKVTRQHLRRVFDDIGLIQIDAVNVLVRSQELPLFSRLGAHPRSLIPDAVDDGELFEYWVHAASLVPTEHRHLWRWRMDRFNATSEGRWFTTHRAQIERVLEQVRTQGAIAVGDVHGRVRNKGPWWDWDDAKIALEMLFDRGLLGAKRRRSDFARIYDTVDRLLPAKVLEQPPTPERDARRQLLLLAARSLGVATLPDLADYHRLRIPACKPIVAELVAEGALIPVEVEGWNKPALLHPDAVTPRTVTGRALLSPFDSLVWLRDRTERIFGFNYRLEIYVPKPKRVYGYYVLPFLLDGHLAGRVDLKADRGAGVLRVQAAHVEPDLDNPHDRPRIAEELLAELREMARWLTLDVVGVTGRGALAKDLLAAGAEAIDDRGTVDDETAAGNQRVGNDA